MNSGKLSLIALALSLTGASNAFSAVAGVPYELLIQTMVRSGFADAKVIKKNISVYRTILSNVDQTIRNEQIASAARSRFAIQNIDDLSSRLNSQLGYCGQFSETLGLGIYSELSAAKKAAQSNQFSEIAARIAVANQTLQSIEQSL